MEKTISLFVSRGQRITPFTPEEPMNCNVFVTAVFEKELRKMKYKSIKDGWNDLISHINCFDQ